MIGETPIMVVLTWYFEIVLATGGGARHPLFFLTDLRDWLSAKLGRSSVSDEAFAPALSVDHGDEAADVKRERERAEAGGEDQAVRVLNFRKVFGSGRGLEKVAVKDLSFAVNKRECFGLLGHNGAGKVHSIVLFCFMTFSRTCERLFIRPSLPCLRRRPSTCFAGCINPRAGAP
jgi:hypothetical protein